MQKINDFGKEDKSFLEKYDFRHLIISHYRGIIRLIQKIYFDHNRPSNQTIKYHTGDTRYILVHDSGVFQPLIKEYVLDTIIIDAWEMLVKYFEDIERCGKRNAFKNTLVSEETLERIDAFVSDYKKLCNGCVPAMLKDIRNDVLELIRFQSIEMEKKNKKKSTRRKSS